MRNTVPTFPCLDLVATACDVNMFIFTISSVKKNLRTQNFRQRICKIWPQLHDALSAIIGRLFFSWWVWKCLQKWIMCYGIVMFHNTSHFFFWAYYSSTITDFEKEILSIKVSHRQVVLISFLSTWFIIQRQLKCLWRMKT